MMCENCNGLIGEKGKSYCYSGKWCFCEKPKPMNYLVQVLSTLSPIIDKKDKKD